MNAQPAASLIRIRDGLSERDLDILRDVSRVRLAGAQHLQRLHFHTGTELSRTRRARRTLQRLTDAGLLKRMDRRIGGVRAGSAGYVYALDTLGQRLLTTGGPAGGQRRRRPWEPSPAFQDHILAVTDLYVTLRELERQDPTIELLSFDAEPVCWRSFTTHTGLSITLKPDAYVSLGIGEFEQVSFIEIDRSTEHWPTLRRKLGVYVDALNAGVDNDDQTAFPTVAWIVPDRNRARFLNRQIRTLDTAHRGLFTVTTFNNPTAHLKGGEQ